MPQPTPYARGFSFTDFAAATPLLAPPGVHIDAELDAIEQTTDEILRNLDLIQRDDGRLRNGIVGLENFGTSALAAFASIGTRILPWQTGAAYLPRDFAIDGADCYLVVTAHTAGVLATDAAANRLILIFQNVAVDALEAADAALGALDGPLFTAASGMAIPLIVTQIRTSGYSARGRGQAAYVYDSALTALDVAARPQEMFLDAAGRAFKLSEPILSPEMFGAAGNGTLLVGATDDSVALHAMVAKVNADGTGHIRFASGKTYLLGHVNDETLYFHDLTGVTIEGWGATLKTKTAGCPTNGLGYNWGQINFSNCTNVKVLGLTFDGNRDGQTHTAPLTDGHGFNGGIVFFAGDFYPNSHHIQIRGCRFVDHGVLAGSSDFRGDGIFAVSGATYMQIEDCMFVNCGRWAFSLAEGANASTHIYFRRNIVLLADRADNGTYPWGAIDFEDWGLNHSHFYIDDNLFVGTSQISIGGYSAIQRIVTHSDISIRRNYWLLPDGAGAANVPFLLGGGNPTLPGSYRTLKRMFIEDNEIIFEGAANNTHIGYGAKMEDVYIRRNMWKAQVATATADNGVVIGFGGHIAGDIEISRNVFIGLGAALKNGNSWYPDSTPGSVKLLIEGNRFDNCNRAFELSFTDIVSNPTTSRVIIRNNRSENTRDSAGEFVDAGPLILEFYDLFMHDKVWAHVGVRYRGPDQGRGTTGAVSALDIPLSGGFRAYEITLKDVSTNTNSVEFWCRLSTNAGVSFLAGATDYEYANEHIRSDAAANAFTSTNSDGASKIVLCDSMMAATLASLRVRVSGTTPPIVVSEGMSSINGAHLMASQRTVGAYKPGNSGVGAVTTAVNAIRFLSSSGLIACSWQVRGIE